MPEGAAAYADFLQDFKTHFGLIETILSEGGRLPHWNGHDHRLRTSMEALGWPLHEEWPEQVYKEILAALAANRLTGRARIRLRVFKSSDQIHYLVESSGFPFERNAGLLNIGLAVGLAVTADEHSFMKNNQRAVYEAAARQARERGFQDMLLLNAAGHVVESAIANVFILQDNRLRTPPLSDGCVQGVFRQGLLSGTIYFQGSRPEESPLTPGDIENAEAVFLGNALRGMRRVDNVFL